MKKRMIILMGILLCACSPGTTASTETSYMETEQEMEQKEIESSISETEFVPPETISEEGTTNYEPFQVDNPDYDSETDDPIFLSMAQAAVTDSGVYYMNLDFLYYHEYETDITVPVCIQVNCQHNDESCDAYYDARYNNMDFGFWYYKGDLYYLASEDGRTFSLWKTAGDGTGREKLSELFTLEGADDFIYNATVHRGYLYYSLSNEGYKKNAKLYRVELKKNGKVETVFEAEHTRTTVYRIRGYGDGVFFQRGNYPDIEDIDTQFKYYTADVFYVDHKGNVTKVLPGPQKDYTIKDDCIYYTTNTKVRRFNMKTGVDEVFVDTGRICNVSCDDNYVYLDDYYGVLLDETISPGTRTISVWSYEGEKIQEWNIPNSQGRLCYFGDENYLWIKWYGENLDVSVWKYLDKSKIGTDEATWENWHSM